MCDCGQIFFQLAEISINWVSGMLVYTQAVICTVSMDSPNDACGDFLLTPVPNPSFLVLMIGLKNRESANGLGILGHGAWHRESLRSTS